jgi:Domain of unknown function (DUF4386)
MAVSIQDPEAVRSADPTDPTRKNAVVAGSLFIVATAASLLSGPFLAPVTGSGYLTAASAHHTQVAIGVTIGLIAALAAPGIAIALYPVLRRFDEGLALGAVAFRTIEGVFYALGMAILLSVSTLSRNFVDAGAPAAGTALLMVAAVLVVFGVFGPLSAGQIVLAVPIGVQELVLAGWLIVKGFNRSPGPMLPSGSGPAPRQ